MSMPKMRVPDPIKYSTPVEIDDATVTGAKDEALRRAKGRGYSGTILTGVGGGLPPAGLKTILGG
jgi:hypothetical protein